MQELLQVRATPYRNLRAPHSKLQEVNWQKMVFPASAVHELKIPPAGVKGYCDLMLTGSPGLLTDSDKGDRPDFIVLDVLMPGLNRVETLKE